jgi:hypothetical protein
MKKEENVKEKGIMGKAKGRKRKKEKRGSKRVK